MNAGNTFENEILKLIFQNIDITGIGDSGGLRGSVTAGSVYIRLCTNAVMVSDSQIGTECAYTGYVSGGVAVARTSSEWSVIANVVTNINAVTFGECTGGSETVTYIEVWRNNTGTLESDRIGWAELTSSLAVSTGIVPEYGSGDISITFD